MTRLTQSRRAWLLAALLALPAAEALAQAGASPSPSPEATRETVAAAETDVGVAEPSEPAPEASPDALTLGLYGGMFLPRKELPLAPVVGVDASFAFAERLQLFGGADWALLADQTTTLLAPPEFPRGQADFIQLTHVVTVFAGLGYRLFDVGPGDVTVGAALALSVTDTTFEAYGTQRTDTDVGPGVLAEATLQYPVGPVRLRARVGYREAVHDLGGAGRFGDEVVSGLLAGLGLGVAL